MGFLVVIAQKKDVRLRFCIDYLGIEQMDEGRQCSYPKCGRNKKYLMAWPGQPFSRNFIYSLDTCRYGWLSK